MAESYYVLERFSELCEMLGRTAEILPIKRNAIEVYRGKNNLVRAQETYKELESEIKKLTGNICALRLLFLECDMAEGADFAAKLFAAVGRFNLMTPDYTKLTAAILHMRSMIPDIETADASKIGHLMNNLRMGYYPTELEHMKMLKAGLEFPAESVNMLDPCCGCGLALEELAAGENAVTYGIELDRDRAKTAETHLDRVGFGSYFHSLISRDAFHVLFLNPPYLSVINENGTKARHEKRFLVESLYHLMYGGVMIYVIPYYRLTADICRIICDNFENISVFRFMDKEFAKYKQVAVIGTRKPKSESGKQTKMLLGYAMMPEKIPYISELAPKCYHIPDRDKKIETFKGAEFNVGELKRQLARSKSIDMLFEKSRIDAMEKRPLLPLSIGQVGLIGGSGLINGYMDCDKPHVIKGRVVKETKKWFDHENETLTETTVNKMLFNILTPDGVKRLS